MRHALILFFLFFSPNLFAATADELFEKQKFAEALPLYEKQLSSAQGEDRLRAQYRVIECESLLFRHEQAFDRLSKVTFPSAPLWRARFLLLNAEVARLFLAHYRPIVAQDAEEANAGEKSRAQWERTVADTYQSLWEMRAKLAGFSLGKSEFSFYTKRADFDRYPTYLDFLVLRWSSSLLEQRKTNTAQLAKLYEQAAAIGGKNRGTAREAWALDRVLLLYRDSKSKLPMELKSLLGRARTGRGKADASYELASASERNESFAEAVELCTQVEKSWPKFVSAHRCHELRALIQLPRLELETGVIAPNRKGRFGIKSRNLDTVYFRVIPASVEKLRQLSAVSKQTIGDFDYLRSLNEIGAAALLKEKPVAEWSVPTPAPKKFAWLESEPELAPLAQGFYVLFASAGPKFESGKELIVQTVMNVSSLFLVGSTGFKGLPEYDSPKKLVGFSGPAFHLRLVDAQSGIPVGGAKLDGYVRENWTRASSISGETDSEGRYALAAKIGRTSVNSGLDVLGRANSQYALFRHPLSFYYPLPAAYELHLDLDRAVFRPGQKLQWRGTVLERGSEGVRVPRSPKEVTVIVTDPNGQEIHKTKSTFNGYGSVKGETTIPSGRLLGQYGIRAFFSEGSEEFAGYGNFQVEEYKRPEFEVTLDDAKGAWKFGQPAAVTGQVKYFAGPGAAKAKVSFRVHREVFLPWFGWGFYRSWARVEREEVTAGELQTDEKGIFTVRFRPEADPETGTDLPARFTVEVFARDGGGRTIESSRTYVAGAKSIGFEIETPTAFFNVRSRNEFKVRALNLNEKPVSVKGRYEVEKLPLFRPKETKQFFSAKGSQSLEEIYKGVRAEASVAKGEFQTPAEEKQVVALPILAEGVYRLIVSAADPFGGRAETSRIILVSGNTGLASDGYLPSVTLPEKSKYVVGQTARVLLGSSELSGPIYLQLWTGSELLEEQMLSGKGLRLFELKISNRWRGGGTVRWFGAHNFQFYSGEAFIDVPWSDKELRFTGQLEKVLSPREEAKLTFEALGARGQPAEAEMLLRVYDRSLDYYAAVQEPWVKSLYRRGPGPAALAFPTLKGLIGYLHVAQSWLLDKYVGEFKAKMESLEPPALWVQRSRMGNYGMVRSRGQMEVAADASIVKEAMSLSAVAPQSAPPAGGSAALVEGNSARSPEKPQVRSEFAETAYFGPQIRIVGGKAQVRFNMPDQLTSWKVMALALTNDGEWGYFSDEITTKKDFMVKAEIPRFFREKDQGVVKALLLNETSRALEAKVTFSLLEQDKDVTAQFGGVTSRTLALAPKGQGVAVFPVSIPVGVRQLKVRILASAGSLKDAEERDLPIFPSRERLVASQVVALSGKASRELKLPAKGTLETAELRVEPQLALALLSALPSLIRTPYETTDSLISRYVPLAILETIYRNHPALAAAVKKLPSRKTVRPEWEQNDSRRVLDLLESPWVDASRGGERNSDLIPLLSEAKVKEEAKNIFERLKALQLADGGFPWCPGGQSDLYITLHVLSQLAEAQRYQVAVPREVVRSAALYTINELPKHLKPREADVALALYAAYVLSALDLGAEKQIEWKTLCKTWVDYAAEHSTAMTPMGRAYAAHVYWKLGENEKGDSFLETALANSKEEPLVGRYWAPEKKSWLWYSDSVEKHAFFLRTLAFRRPNDPRIPGLMTWLLFHRKGNEWKSTKSSVAAVFSLLDLMKREGALDQDQTFKIQWGKTEESLKIGPTEWLSSPLQWKKTGTELASASAKVDKDGPGTAFASLTSIFSTDELPTASTGELLGLERRFLKRVRREGGYRLVPLKSGAQVAVGDEIEVQLKIRTKSQFEYIYLKDPRGAGFEAVERLSGWKWDVIGRYEEPRDSLSNFFISWVPHGEYVLKYRLRAVTPGTYRVGAAILQSLYSPDFAAHSSGVVLSIKE